MKHDFSARLKSAMRERSPTWISTALDFHFTGIVVGVGSEWGVVEVVDEAIRLNGFEAFRISEISNVGHSPHAEFIAAALEVRQQRASEVCPVDLGGTGDLLASASANYPLLVIHKDRAPVSICFGTILEVDGGIMWMREMNTDAVWQPSPTHHRLADITQISFGGGHEEVLALVAGAPPSAIVPLRPKAKTV